ncbi:MAG: endo-1,4-beta-xylanase [Lachnospiraceae bacterium]|nr:endo-1,4-beta-xylanase [Lachnospiraceae bacterium]
MKVGSCVHSGVIESQSMEKILLEQYSSITMENAMKPDSILSLDHCQTTGSLTVDYSSETVQILNWAKAHEMPMRGHTLIWYSQTPEWIFHQNFDESQPYVGRDEMLVRMEDLIRSNFEELEKQDCLDLFYAYDVVNEGFMEDGSMRRNHWYEIIGEDYIWYAFYYADKYAPESIDLYYNDYNEQYKDETLCEFVETLVDEDGRSLIDGIGMQAHLFTADDLNTYLEGVDQLAETGLKLQITELDLGLGAYESPAVPTQDKLKEQGRYYYDLLNGIFQRADDGKIRMDAVTFWGFTDHSSWRSEYSPQLFDEELLPKYAYYGAMQIKEYAGY